MPWRLASPCSIARRWWANLDADRQVVGVVHRELSRVHRYARRPEFHFRWGSRLPSAQGGATQANALIMLSKACGNEAFHPVVGLHSKTP